MEIISLILRSAEEGATRISLMYETYLSQSALESYLVRLVKKGFIEYLTGEMKFKTTAKGARYLTSITEAAEIACSHQCNKCGVLYNCGTNNCKEPFQNAVCNRCIQFYSTHGSVPQISEIKDEVSLSVL